MKRRHAMSEANRRAAGERLRKLHETRRAQRESAALLERARPEPLTPTEPAEGADVPSLEQGVAVAEPRRERAPEVQAVLDSMTPERRAKLEMHQAQVLATREGQQALARLEQEKQAGTIPTVIPPAMGISLTGNAPQRIGSREVSLIVRTDGTMVSQWGPCTCGAAKRQWHAIH
jgi:hypothetical protein